MWARSQAGSFWWNHQSLTHLIPLHNPHSHTLIWEEASHMGGSSHRLHCLCQGGQKMPCSSSVVFSCKTDWGRMPPPTPRRPSSNNGLEKLAERFGKSSEASLSLRSSKPIPNNFYTQALPEDLPHAAPQPDQTNGQLAVHGHLWEGRDRWRNYTLHLRDRKSDVK